ncbi:MAG: hypothetical protein U0N54_06450, partial [Slackia piriformis]
SRRRSISSQIPGQGEGQSPSLSRIAVRSGRLRRLLAGTAYTNIRDTTAGELTRSQDNALFVFDEPTIGLHPLDVEVLLDVLQRLVDAGATVVVIEHDLDMITNADYVIDLGPGGGEDGGEVVVCGTPEEVASCERSVTGRYIKEELEP